MKRTFTVAALMVAAATLTFAFCQRSDVLLREGWKFTRGDAAKSEIVTVPHDWAIYGPFDRNNDLQVVQIVQNNETEATVKTGRTGGLPYEGEGTYERTIKVANPKEKTSLLVIDGAMADAHVLLNGREVAQWPYGYNSFVVDITDAAVEGDNLLTIKLNNLPRSSRWYSGAGLYRNVHLVTTGKTHIPEWGTQVTTPYVGRDYGTVKMLVKVNGVPDGENVTLKSRIIDLADGNIVAVDETERLMIPEIKALEQNFTVAAPRLWTPEHPNRYRIVTDLYYKGVKTDSYTTPLGFRTIEVRTGKGFFLNGERRQFKGVCNHHDLGPLGAAINVEALRHQLEMLKDMGCDAIRTSHNMPAPELVALCDSMGFMMMLESFDEWDVAKCENGYHRVFDQWAERDITNLVEHYRNNPSVVMWSIGNEIPSQWMPEGRPVAKMLQDLCHRLDPTRPVTCGMDQIDAVTNNGFASILDIPGFNYRAHRYHDVFDKLPQKVLLGSETASTVSSRGVYKFPMEQRKDANYDDHQSSAYDVEACNWSNLPEEDFANADDNEWEMGQFVWTGFDYLGEPWPYEHDGWPNHSSMFGIIDLASIPKDRYYLYRSVWNTESPTLHVLPHWNWKGREGEVTPVMVYTSYPKAELFVNGKSCGIREKNNSSLLTRYRLIWDDVKYQPGEIRVVAYDAQGNAAAEQTIKTSGKPYALKLTPHKSTLKADGDDLAYVTVTVVDKDGNPVPDATHEVSFDVKGAGRFRATANGDPTCLYIFHKPVMPLFSGAATAIVQSGKQAGTVTLTAKAKGLKAATLTLPVK